jgi:hypothetical protein
MRRPHSRKGVKVQTQTYTTQKEAKKAAARAYGPAIVRLANGRYACFHAGDNLPRGARAWVVAGAPTGGAPTSSRRDVMDRAAEDGRALLEAAQQIHAERHGPQTFVPGTLLPFLEAAKRSGIRSDRQRYHDAIKDLEYEGAIEWDTSALSARGDKHYLITERGLKMLREPL